MQHLPDQGRVRRAAELVITMTLLEINLDQACSSQSFPGLMDTPILVRIIPMSTMGAEVIIMIRGHLRLEGALVHPIHHEIMVDTFLGVGRSDLIKYPQQTSLIQVLVHRFLVTAFVIFLVPDTLKLP